MKGNSTLVQAIKRTVAKDEVLSTLWELRVLESVARWMSWIENKEVKSKWKSVDNLLIWQLFPLRVESLSSFLLFRTLPGRRRSRPIKRPWKKQSPFSTFPFFPIRILYQSDQMMKIDKFLLSWTWNKRSALFISIETCQIWADPSDELSWDTPVPSTRSILIDAGSTNSVRGGSLFS